MASFNFDQAEGLRRMLAGPKPRIVTFLSATTVDEKSAMLLNLGASLAQGGSEVLLLDACSPGYGAASRMDLPRGGTLLDVVRQERALDEVVQRLPQSFSVAVLTRIARRGGAADAAVARRLSNTLGVLASQNDIVLVDAELGDDDTLPVPSLAQGEIVVQVANTPDSIKAAYSLIKRLHGQLGRRPFGVLVTGATDDEAKLVYQNMAQAASRYLALQLTSVGSVPADEHVRRAARLGRAVIDAFPMAGASVAFRRLAGQFALPAGAHS